MRWFGEGALEKYPDGQLAGVLLYDKFPAFQSWADDFESILAFLESQGEFDRFRNRLCARERYGALAEARAGFYFHRNGFQIPRWEPEEVPGVPGDLEIAWPDTEPIFLEVKCPSWQGELSEGERDSRIKQPKYIDESRAVDPMERVIYVVGKSLPKFSPTCVNLAVVVDNLFMSPLSLSLNRVYGRIARELADIRYAAVSGVLLINPEKFVHRAEVEYRVLLIPGHGKPLPEPVITDLLKRGRSGHVQKSDIGRRSVKLRGRGGRKS